MIPVNLIIVFLTLVLATCSSKKKDKEVTDLEPDETEDVGLTDPDFESSKPHVVFRLPIKNFESRKMKAFLDQEDHSLGRQFPVVLVIVDTLRNDYAKREMPVFQSYISQKEDGWLDLEEGLSSSTITHFSTYAIFYGHTSFLRDFTFRAGWSEGSPFFNILKKANYKIRNYGSPWQNCFNSDRIFNSNEKELKWSGAMNLQALFGQNPKDFTDFCFEGRPNEAAYFKEIPEEITVNGKTVKLISKDYAMQHQGYQDYYVFDKFKSDLEAGKISDNTFTQLYFYSVHMGYAWPEFGLPDKKWSSFSREDVFNVYKPYFSWNPNEHEYLEFKLPELNLINSYKNSVRYIDYLMGELIKSLKDSGKYDETMIVFVSDHGEKINEADISVESWKKGAKRVGATHCCIPVPSNDRVPIYIKIPKSLRSELNLTTKNLPRHYDIFPTVLDALNYNHLSEMSPLITGKSLLADRKGNCNITVSPRGVYGPRDFVFSNGKKSLYLRLDEMKTTDALGVFFLRETSATNATKNVREFKKSDENMKKLEKYLKDRDYSECFIDLFGDQYMKTIWFGERLQEFHRQQ